MRIPQEVMEPQAIAKGDIRFCPLAYLEAEIEQPILSPRELCSRAL